MDKPKNGKTITIKINGKESSFMKEKKREHPINKKTTGTEKQQQSQLSNQVKREAAVAKESTEDDEQFDWVLPRTGNLPEIEECKTDPPEKKKSDKLKISTYFGKGIKGKKFSTKGINISMVSAVFFAVLLGTFFGLLLLKVVPSEKVVGEEAPVVETEQQSDTPAAVSGNVEITLPDLSTAIVQEGIYSSQGGAEDIQATLKDKGIPSVIVPINGQFAIFVRVADSVADAKTMGKGLSESGISNFSKEFVIGEKTIGNLHEQEKKLLELSPLLYQTLTASVTSATNSNSIPASLMEDFEKQSSNLAGIDKEKLQNEEVAGIHSQLEAATVQLKIYDKNPEPSTLNLIQQHLLSFLAHYQSL
ncbi:hypothetical protein JMM81_00850 [Bacillus sp. V3B]|uniref:SPOR domain-containing protein n=1 Tax=Bacillus sp. V3B TaxID=2804915 RepID=UPI00210BCAE9|nr:hypothetical protein [Bacillus sp. V3B]MCQ6273522.1 hypothetical protein [Bacillus sp. V3B]